MFKRALQSSLHRLGIDVRRYRKQCGKLDFLDQYTIRTVLDIGANVGQSAVEFRAVMPEAQIYSFEPLPDCFEKLSSAMHGDSLFKAFPCGLGATSGRLIIHKSSYAPSSSFIPMGELHKKAFPGSAESRDEVVEVRRLDDVAPELTLLPDVLIKIDVQGFERDVLEGGEKTLRSAKVIIIENSFRELYIGEALFDEIYERMKGLGFSYRGALGQKYDEKTGDILFEDSIFVRE